MRVSWGEHGLKGSWAPGGRLVYREGLSQALSYIACVAHREDVVQKGVPEIKHGMADGYYKCLLFMEALALGDIGPDAREEA